MIVILLSANCIILCFILLGICQGLLEKDRQIEALRYKNIMLESDNLVLKRQIQITKLTQQSNTSRIFNNISKDLIDAVKIARKVSHPDNGGNDTDFRKFNDLYNEMIKGD